MRKISHIFNSILSDVKTIHSTIEDRSDMRYIRISALKKLQEPIVKVAFDTRRINQDTEYNPRRNLQHYHRSEPFISKDASENIKTLFKLKAVVDSIKDDFTGDPDWLDSYCRILSTALDRTLRIQQNDMDFFQPQMDYLNELLYLRYRIKDTDVISMNEKELRNIVLGRDEKLLHKQIYARYNSDIKSGNQSESNDQMMKDSNITGNQVVKDSSNSSRITSKDGEKAINVTINIG